MPWAGLRPVSRLIASQGRENHSLTTQFPDPSISMAVILLVLLSGLLAILQDCPSADNRPTLIMWVRPGPMFWEQSERRSVASPKGQCATLHARL